MAEESTAAAVAWLEARGLAFEVVEHLVPKGLDVVEFMTRVGPAAAASSSWACEGNPGRCRHSPAGADAR